MLLSIKLLLFAFISTTITLINCNLCTNNEDSSGNQACFKASSYEIANGTHFKIQQTKEITFECLISNKNAQTSVAWLHNNQLLSIDSRLLKPDTNLELVSDGASKFNLHIKYVDVYHTGTYTCQLVTSGTQNLVYSLDVLVPPSITRVPFSNVIEVREGDNLTVQCLTTGNPQAKVTWSKKGNHLTNIKINNNTHMSIVHVVRSNADTYSCTAMNGVGDPITSEFQILIKYAPQVKFLTTFESIVNDTLYASIGKREQLICHIQAYPKPNLTLFHNHIQIQESNLLITQSEQSTYTLTYTIGVTHQTKGVYKCVAENEVDSSEDTLRVSNGISNLSPNLTHSQVYSDAFIFEWSCVSGSSIDEIETQFLNTWNQSINSTESSKTKRLLLDASSETSDVPSIHIRNFHEINKLVFNTSYVIRIRVKNVDGEWSTWSQNITFKTLDDSHQKINYHKSLIHQSHHRHQHEKKYKFEGYKSLNQQEKQVNSFAFRIQFFSYSLLSLIVGVFFL